MAKAQKHIQDFFEDKARAGDGSFAIAFALLELTREQKTIGRRLDAIGLNSESGKAMGGLEMIASQLKQLRSIADRAVKALKDRG